MRTIGLEFVERGKLRFCELGDPPPPGPTQVLLETKYFGVTNGTERHAFLVEHGYGGGQFPSRHGYQHVGEVVAVGEAVTKFRPGDWAFLGQYVGHRGWNVEDENGLLVKLPDTVDRRHCALFGVAGVALRGVRRLGVQAGDNVWVAGLGPLGQFVAQAARAVGARVTVTDMLESRLEVARRCGAHVALDAREGGTVEALRAGGPYDFLYDCCSAERLLFDIHEHRLLAFGGTVGLLAVRQQVTYPWSLLHGTQARIETSCHFEGDDLRVLLFLYEQRQLVIEPVVSHLVSIDEAAAIYAQLAQAAGELLGVVFEWTAN